MIILIELEMIENGFPLFGYACLYNYFYEIVQKYTKEIPLL